MGLAIANFIEFMNLYLVMLDACLIGFLGWYLYYYSRDGAPDLAGALIVYLAGHIWIRGWTWWQWFVREGPHWSDDYSQTLMFSIGLGITTVGLIFVMNRVMQMIPIRVWAIVVTGSAGLSALITWGHRWNFVW